MASIILFLCPHHAAKSVIAAAYFNRLAQQSNLALRADSAGTDPAEAVSPSAVDMLRGEGIDVSRHQPRRVTQADLDQTERIISMGCTSAELGIAPERVELWDGVPSVSQNIIGARDAIRAHVERLIAQLWDVSFVG
jgi:protein-tyrosine-phosphatase